MRNLALIISASALVIGLGAASTDALAAHKALPAAATSPASPAQLQREHQRAVAAGDKANDPANSASSDALNQAQVNGTVIAAATPATGDTSATTSTQTTATTSGQASDMTTGTDATAQAPAAPQPDAAPAPKPAPMPMQ